MVEDKVLKGRIARVIAATRFPFVGQDDWDESRTTVVNDYRNREWAFDTPDGPLYPSVAVLNEDGTIRECREVERSVPVPNLFEVGGITCVTAEVETEAL